MLAERSFDGIVDKIYWAANEGGSWQEVASDVAKMSGAVSCSLQLRSGAKTRILGTAGYNDFRPELYELDYAQKDIRAQLLMTLPANEPHLLHHHMSQEHFRKSDYYNEFFRHFRRSLERGSVAHLRSRRDARNRNSSCQESGPG